MKKQLLTLILTAAATLAMASPVNQETTQRIANFFFVEHGGTSSLMYIEMPQYPHMHFYRATDNNGFVIMSADDVVFPVLAYSTTNSMSTGEIPANVAYWLSEYENEIVWNIENNNATAEAVTAEWQHLSNAAPTQLMAKPQKAPQTLNTANLISTQWSQSPYYNSQCPYDSSEQERTVTGCVATAMGQIMKYWGFPLRGVGSYSYNDPPYGTQAANFADTVFDYASMPNKLTSSSTQAQVNAVALLLRRCGIAAEMEYGVDASSATTIGYGEVGYKSAENALRENFKFKHTLHSVSIADYTNSEWAAILTNEINNGRPMQYSAGNDLSSGGHSFLCCGYDNTGKFYFNWGWNGGYDGYYTIGQLNPTSSSHYNKRNKAIIGIEPDTTNSTTTTITLNSSIPNGCTLTGAGTYNSNVDEVTIKALAKPGYLVDGWGDNLTYNPYTFIANGGNITHTAKCTKITGDTVGYCRDGYYTSYGSSKQATHKWAIRLDSASVAPNRMLDKVMTYISETGDYTLDICYGDEEAPSKQVIYTDNVSASYSDFWGTVSLSTPVAVDRAKSLWIILTWSGSSYPMSCSEFRGNIDASWVYDDDDDEWINYFTSYDIRKSWMIRGIFANNPGPYQINVVPNNTNYGLTIGSGLYPADTTIVISATAKESRYRFLHWNDGVTSAARTVTVKDAYTYTAIFEDTRADVEEAQIDNIAAYSNGKNIVIENAEGHTAAIYDAVGRMIMTRMINTSHETISLPTGVYFVKIDTKTMSVVL